jgi:hypothetical protein
MAFTWRMDPPRRVHLRYGPHSTISLPYLLSPILPTDFMVGETTLRPGYAPPPPLPRPRAAFAASPATHRLCLRRRRAPAMPAPPHTSPSHGAAPPAAFSRSSPAKFSLAVARPWPSFRLLRSSFAVPQLLRPPQQAGVGGCRWRGDWHTAAATTSCRRHPKRRRCHCCHRRRQRCSRRQHLLTFLTGVLSAQCYNRKNLLLYLFYVLEFLERIFTTFYSVDLHRNSRRRTSSDFFCSDATLVQKICSNVSGEVSGKITSSEKICYDASIV